MILSVMAKYMFLLNTLSLKNLSIYSLSLKTKQNSFHLFFNFYKLNKTYAQLARGLNFGRVRRMIYTTNALHSLSPLKKQTNRKQSLKDCSNILHLWHNKYAYLTFSTHAP